MKYQLRDYQKEAVETVNQLPDGSRSVVVLATGLGKTVVAANFDFHGRVLWISHRDELVRQPEKYFTARGMSYGIEKADEHPKDGCDVVSASIQSISRDNRLIQYNPDDFDTIICDEVQHAAAKTYRKVLSYFHPRKLIGLTATPKRGDKVRLTDSFDSICFSRDLRWGIKNHWLSPIRGMMLYSDYDLGNVAKLNGDYVQSALSDEMKQSDNASVVVRAYMDYCRTERRQTLIYCPTVAICKIVEGALKKALPEEEKETVRMLYDKIDPEERKKILTDYQKGNVRCIVNCMILTEGTDLPKTSAIINDRPSCNTSLYQQIVGRGTRTAEGKDYCLVIDIVGSKDEREIPDMCTAPTLFGIDPNALPKDIRQNLRETDLLDLSDTLAEDALAKAKNLRVRIEMIDFFTEEREAIINTHKQEGPAAIAKGYAEKLKNDMSETGIDFGDMIVKLMPTEERRYLVKPSFQGNIWFSEPDLLGNTVVTMNVPEDDHLRLQLPPMPMEKAVPFVQDYMEACLPPWFRVAWSKKARAVMNVQDITEKQNFRLRSICEEYDIEDVGTATRLEASDLIDMTVDMQQMEKEKHAIEKAEADRQKKRTGKNKEKWLAKQEALKEREIAEQAQYTSNIEDKKKRIEQAVRIYKESEKRKAREWKNLLNGKVQFTVSVHGLGACQPEPDASDKQMRFISSLARELEAKNFLLDENPISAETAFSMRQASMVITALLQIKDRTDIARDKTIPVIVNFHAFLDAIGIDKQYLDSSKVWELEKKTYTISCRSPEENDKLSSIESDERSNYNEP